MIRSLRRSHRGLWILMALALPLAYAIALRSRPQPVLPHPAVPGGWSTLSVSTDGDARPLAPSPLALVPATGGQLRLVTIGDVDELPPGLFLYATTSPVMAGEPLPADAQLLGVAEPQTSIPASEGSGVLLLYSVMRGEVIGVASASGGTR